MKTNQKAAVSILVLIGFVVGMIIGVSLTNPGMSLIEAAGTIGKVDKYRNVKITEHDIELRNELLADESLREALKNYLVFEYTANVKMAEDIQFSMEAAREIALFNAANTRNLMKLEDYVQILDNARLDLLEAISVLDGLKHRDRIAIHGVLNNACNAVMQSHHHHHVLFDFMNAVELFLSAGPAGNFSRLERSHDLLFADLLSSAIVHNNRMAVRHLMLETDLLSQRENLALSHEALQARLELDLKNPSRGLKDVNAEQLGIIDAEQVGLFWPVDLFDSFDAEQLSSMINLQDVRAMDAEELNAFFQNEQFLAFNISQMEQFQVQGKFDNLLEAKDQLEMFAARRVFER